MAANNRRHDYRRETRCQGRRRHQVANDHHHNDDDNDNGMNGQHLVTNKPHRSTNHAMLKGDVFSKLHYSYEPREMVWTHMWNERDGVALTSSYLEVALANSLARFPDMNLLDRYRYCTLLYFSRRKFVRYFSFREVHVYQTHVELVQFLIAMFVVGEMISAAATTTTKAAVNNNTVETLKRRNMLEWLVYVGGIPNHIVSKKCFQTKILDELGKAHNYWLIMHATTWTLNELVGMVADFAKHSNQQVGELIGNILNRYEDRFDINNNNNLTVHRPNNSRRRGKRLDAYCHHCQQRRRRCCRCATVTDHDRVNDVDNNNTDATDDNNSNDDKLDSHQCDQVFAVDHYDDAVSYGVMD